MVYLATALTALFYLMNIPVRALATLDIGRANRLTFHIGIFSRGWLFEKRVSLRAPSPDLWSGWTTTRQDPRFRAARSALGSLFRNARVRVRVELGTGDACATALLCGTLSSALRALLAVVGVRGAQTEIAPDFNHARVLVAAGGIVRVRLGHIILAALAGAREYGAGRIRQWKNTRLKTS